MAERTTQQSEEQLELATERVRLAREISRWFGIAIVVVLAWIPLSALVRIVGTIAGKRTDFDFNFSVTISFAFTLALAGGAAWKILAQRRELQRVRRRVTRLERELQDYRRGTRGPI